MQAPQTQIPVYEVEQHVADHMESLSETDPEVAKLHGELEGIISRIAQLERSIKPAELEVIKAHVSYQKWNQSSSKVLSEGPYHMEAVAKTEKNVSDLKTAIKEAYVKKEEYSSAWALLKQAFTLKFLSETLGGTKFKVVNVTDPSDKKGRKKMTVYVLA